MSMERRCKLCGELEKIRFNFGDDREAERKFHETPYICNYCKDIKS